ncbi:hypothetical protein [Phaeobacter porticola]|uniref:Uncharacterized protein n=1 Tax=Phaeobacter porticola TaxID=1844006 RepID=A0A1L3I2E3_9RHOB|nr:hypothetical protein [Phaeobacter porticola]APG46279.1 hypothetical protein PhaeoP97_00846 [Phaeobacter porticola]
MPQHSNLNDALNVLDDKLRSLSALTKANAFLVDIMRKDRDMLEQMEGEAARAMLLDRAQHAFGDIAGEDADPDTLQVLEVALMQSKSAEIIPFPNSHRN